MSLYYQDENVSLHHGDCIEVMRSIPAESVDSIVTDPPYGLGFMGKKWDALPPGEEWARECLRVLKPGGHLLAFGGSRTWHRLAVAIEDAGFEMRDSLAWLYGSGFPKSHDISKAIDKMAGAERQVIGVNPRAAQQTPKAGDLTLGKYSGTSPDLTTPATSEAQQWEGWGTALKPAYEPVVMARKPFTGTVAGNVLEYGTGAINIDACRIAGEPVRIENYASTGPQGMMSHGHGGGSGHAGEERTARISTSGRWPANVILDEHTAELLDEQSGTLKSGGSMHEKSTASTGIYGEFGGKRNTYRTPDSGGASRFFYCAKAGKSERPVVDGVAHPTVKPLTLMRYLTKLVTPADGTILDPFAGSGTTIEAALIEGCNVIGIEQEAEFLPLIEARIQRSKPDNQATLDLGDIA